MEKIKFFVRKKSNFGPYSGPIWCKTSFSYTVRGKWFDLIDECKRAAKELSEASGIEFFVESIPEESCSEKYPYFNLV